MKDEKIENLIRRINFLTTIFMLLPFLTTVTAIPFLPDLIRLIMTWMALLTDGEVSTNHSLSL